MIVLGIIFGLIAFCAINSLVGEFVISKAGTGVLPGLVAAVWAAYPFFHKARIHSINFLHPGLVKYPVNVQVAFSKIRRILSESSYFYGDKWYVVTADTATNCIVADLRFYEEEIRIETTGYGHCHQRQVRMQRFIRLNLTLNPNGIAESNVQMDFEIKAEGFNKQSCENIVADLKTKIEEEIGPGQNQEALVSDSIPPASWWLIGATSFALICMFIDINKNLWGS
ncbi:MAG: hypothetical protein KIT34_15465 [Cyanobacteria bacterium TGS_CYA1]|nr:hypothetical protein [Cyanobacteria bacterium TGS_CYA1]